MSRLGRAPTTNEVAKELAVPAETVHKLVDDVHRATVLNYESLVLEGDAESFLATPDGGPLRYRVRHEAPLWKAGEHPQMTHTVVEGDVGLAV